MSLRTPFKDLTSTFLNGKQEGLEQKQATSQVYKKNIQKIKKIEGIYQNSAKDSNEHNVKYPNIVSPQLNKFQTYQSTIIPRANKNQICSQPILSDRQVYQSNTQQINQKSQESHSIKAPQIQSRQQNQFNTRKQSEKGLLKQESDDQTEEYLNMINISQYERYIYEQKHSNPIAQVSINPYQHLESDLDIQNTVKQIYNFHDEKKLLQCVIDQDEFMTNLKEFLYEKGINQDPYQLAKQAELSQKNLPIAEYFYIQSIQKDIRKESAIKDLATVLHQMGRTEEACQALVKYKDQYDGDQEKYKKQIQPSGKCFLKYLLITGISGDMIRNMFSNTSRIKRIFFVDDLSFSSSFNSRDPFYWMLEFESYSQAKKTLDTFDKRFIRRFPQIKMYWVDIFRKVQNQIDIQAIGSKKFIDDKKIYSPFLQNSPWNEVMLMHVCPTEDTPIKYNPNSVKWGEKQNSYRFSKNCFSDLNLDILERENREQMLLQEYDQDQFVNQLLDL